MLRDAGGLANLYIASDYAQTTTDLATMEGANEAGRHVARGVLEQMGEPDSVVAAVELFDFPEPDMFQRPPRRRQEGWDAAQPLRAADRRRRGGGAT